MERLWSAAGHHESVAHSGSHALDPGMVTVSCFAGGWLTLRLCGMPTSLQVSASTAAWRAEVSPSYDPRNQRSCYRTLQRYEPCGGLAKNLNL